MNKIEEKKTKGNKDLEQEFKEKGYCQKCGSQRCEQTGEWLEGCSQWRKFKKDKNAL